MRRIRLIRKAIRHTREAIEAGQKSPGEVLAFVLDRLRDDGYTEADWLALIELIVELIMAILDRLNLADPQ